MSPFEVVIGETVAKQLLVEQKPENKQQANHQKGLVYRTLDHLSNNQFLSCGSIESVVDEQNNTIATDTSASSRYSSLLRCGIHAVASEDDEIDYEVDDKDYEDILLQINTATTNSSTISSSSSSPKKSPVSAKSPKRKSKNSKRGRLKLRKSPTRKPKRNNSLYRKTMMTAATANEVQDEEFTATTAAASPLAAASADTMQTAQQQLKKTARFARGFADDAGRAIGNLLPTASLQSITARKYTLPDKTVASQVLMYRQLLHTKCRPGLKLSRPYQETPAQKAVMHMPWWEQGIDESKKMVISYDNLITRLWLNGAIEPYQKPQSEATAATTDLLSLGEDDTPAESTSDEPIETFITDGGLPPIPHQFWVDRLGFQQPDPVTDFRSGGVLSLAMMVYMVESKPDICKRFFTGDTKVLPFGITCINVADMIAKFLMLAKSTDRMDALLSQKPFWKMFADPNAITAVQELAMSMLCDVACEVAQEKKIPHLNSSDGLPGDSRTEVSALEFEC